MVDTTPSIPPLVATPASLERLLDAVRVECPDLDFGTPLRLIEGFGSVCWRATLPAIGVEDGGLDEH